MNEAMHHLFELQQLEFEDIITPDAERRITTLRARIPAPILAHYDRLSDTGKKGVAPIRNQTCSGCHMHVPLGVIVQMKSDNDVHLCEYCQRYLYLTLETAAPEKKTRKRIRRVPAHAL
jgi:predicted  nucleic acid-binding Zn-ribbon protein